MKRKRNSILGRITVDRKIVEQFRAGQSASQISNQLSKGKGYVIKVRGLAVEYGFLEQISTEPKLFRSTDRKLPNYPEALFPIIDLRKSKPAEADALLDPHKNGSWSDSIWVGHHRQSSKRFRCRFHVQVLPLS
ncbi:MAG: hypothetical protein IPL83_02375 [Bdellovibrionales bacterium]|nr:hypothetical protein [Bdellovibrionales bacterium]